MGKNECGKNGLLPESLADAVHQSVLDPIVTTKDDEEKLSSFIKMIGEVKKGNSELGSELDKEFREIMRMVAQRYMDTRLIQKGIDVYNKDYAIYIMKQAIHRLMGESFDYPELKGKFKRFARIEMDLNGLKAINSFGGKLSGDKALVQIVVCLRDNKEVKNFLDDHDLVVLLTSEGGDEFAFWVESKNGELDESLLDELCGLIRQQVSRIITSEFFSFKNSDVQAKLEEKGIEYSEKNTLILSMACGYITLHKASLYALKEKEFYGFLRQLKNAKREKYLEFLNRILYQLFNWSEHNTNLQKEAAFQDDKRSDNPDKVIRALMKLRTGDEMDLQQKNRNLSAELENAKEEIVRLKSLLDCQS